MTMKRPKIVKDYRGNDYVREIEHHGNLTLIRNYQVEY